MMKEIRPVYPYLVVKRLSWMLRRWRGDVTDSSCTKMLRLWLGSEFMECMDQEGRISTQHMNRVRVLLNFDTIKDLKENLKHTQSFYICGNSWDDITYIASPVWHTYDKEKDGNLLEGSLDLDEFNMFSNAEKSKDKKIKRTTKKSQIATKKGQKFDASNNIYITNITTVSSNFPAGSSPNGFALEEQLEDVNAFGTNVENFGIQQKEILEPGQGVANDSAPGEQSKSEIRRAARKYLEWVLQQPEPIYRYWVHYCLRCVTVPHTPSGEVFDELRLTEEQGRQVLEILFKEVLPNRMSRGTTFYRPSFIKDPGSRIFWLRKLTLGSDNPLFKKARKRWERCKHDECVR